MSDFYKSMEKEKNRKEPVLNLYYEIKDCIYAVFFFYNKEYKDYIRNRYTDGYYEH